MTTQGDRLVHRSDPVPGAKRDQFRPRDRLRRSRHVPHIYVPRDTRYDPVWHT